MRADFFGPDGDTTWNLERLRKAHPRFRHYNTDIRDRVSVFDLFERVRPDAVIHCAAQPSHDLAAKRPFDDFETNAAGTLNLLEANRRYSAEAPFVFMSTNKVYGYKGKQVRDQIHSFDVVRAFEAFIREPHAGAVYNLGGGRANSISVLEAIAAVETRAGRRLNHSYVEGNRVGDHICYISDLRHLAADYPKWSITWSLDRILDQLVESQLALQPSSPISPRQIA